MRQFSKFTSMLGATLLEIMLVLAVAAMIIVMSVRYYQSAVTNQQANALLQQIQSITAAADHLAQAAGFSYASVSQGSMVALLGGTSGLTTPWATTIAISAATATGYTVTIPSTPPGICTIIIARLGQGQEGQQQNHYTALSPSSPANCTAAGDVKYTYVANP